MISAEINLHEGKALIGRVRKHVVVTDRPAADGGQDRGCTSGELLLLSFGSCVMGSVRDYVEREALPVDIVKADLFIEPPSVPDGSGRLAISVEVKGMLTPEERLALAEIAGSGRVARRFRTNSQIDIRVVAGSPRQRRQAGDRGEAQITAGDAIRTMQGP